MSRDRRQWQNAELQGFRNLPGGKALVKFTGVDDRESAARLRGFYLAVPRDELPQTADDEFYWHDLVGMRALAQNGDPLGKVAGLIRTAAHDILRVADENNNELLIPFVAECAPEVDLKARVIRTAWERDWQ